MTFLNVESLLSLLKICTRGNLYRLAKFKLDWML